MSEQEPEPGSRFVVFNDVTGGVEETDQDPGFGDPNQSLQNQVMGAYSGGVGTSLSAAAATTEGQPTPAMLGDPTAQVLQAAQDNPAVTPDQLRAIQQSLLPLAGLGGVPGMIGQMATNANLVLNNTVKVFAGIDNVFQPEQAGTPGRCASLGDYIGSLQGRYNSGVQGVLDNLTAFTTALVSVPMSLINSFGAAANALLTAIGTGVNSVINSAIQGLSAATSSVLGPLGKAGTAALTAINTGVAAVTAGLRAEATNLSNALNSLLNNPFKMVVPTVNACMKTIFENNPETQSQNTGVAAVPVFSSGS